MVTLDRVSHTCVIAEAGVNHNGSLAMAKELVDVAVEAGADAVKFQTFVADELVTRGAPKAEYQSVDGDESQYEMLKRLELDEAMHRELLRHCERQGIEFLSTPFDLQSVDLLIRLGVQRIKISSGDVTNAPLLLKAASTQKPIILSTGTGTLGEVETALGVLAFGYLEGRGTPSREAFQAASQSVEGQDVLRANVTLLQCTSEYPAPLEEVNLRAMDTMRTAFGLPVGLSDHTSGITVPIAATARGAEVIEKHFTLDRSLDGPDHKASLEPGELQAMVRAIREVETALGFSVKLPTASETKNRSVIRKRIVAAIPIRRGETFTQDNLTVKRAVDGISPLHYWEWLGNSAEKDYEKDEAIGI